MADDDLAAGRAWLDRQFRKARPTEILLPVVEGIGPVWSYTHGGGGWYAFLGSDVRMAEEAWDGCIVECDHHHATEDEAWACASELGRSCVEAVMARGRR